MEASKKIHHRKNGGDVCIVQVSPRPEPVKASFVRQISEDCERARSSFRPSEVSPVGVGGCFFRVGFFVPKTTKVVYIIFFPSNQEEKKTHLIFLGWVKPNYLLSFFIYLYSKHPCKKRLGSWWFFKRFQKMHQGSAREVSATEPLHPTRRVLGGKMLGERLTFL